MPSHLQVSSQRATVNNFAGRVWWGWRDLPGSLSRVLQGILLRSFSGSTVAIWTFSHKNVPWSLSWRGRGNGGFDSTRAWMKGTRNFSHSFTTSKVAEDLGAVFHAECSLAVVRRLLAWYHQCELKRLARTVSVSICRPCGTCFISHEKIARWKISIKMCIPLDWLQVRWKRFSTENCGACVEFAPPNRKPPVVDLRWRKCDQLHLGHPLPQWLSAASRRDGRAWAAWHSRFPAWCALCPFVLGMVLCKLAWCRICVLHFPLSTELCTVAWVDRMADVNVLIYFHCGTRLGFGE